MTFDLFVLHDENTDLAGLSVTGMDGIGDGGAALSSSLALGAACGCCGICGPKPVTLSCSDLGSHCVHVPHTTGTRKTRGVMSGPSSPVWRLI